MKLARTIGTLTLSKYHPGMQSAKLRCVEILPSMDCLGDKTMGGDTIIAWDLCGAGEHDLVALAEGPEAANPFHPKTVPIDASIVALVDAVNTD